MRTVTRRALLPALFGVSLIGLTTDLASAQRVVLRQTAILNYINPF